MEIGSYYNLILLGGAAFALLMSMYLIFYPHNLFANRILGVLVFTWAFTCVSYAVASNDFYITYPHFFGVSSIFTFLFFPLIYLYIRSYLYKNARHVRKGLVHYLPALAYLIVLSPFFAKSAAEKSEMIVNGFPQWVKTIFNIFNILVILQGVFYSVLSLRLLHHFQYFRKSKLSKVQYSSVRWLYFLVMTNVLLWIIGASGTFLMIIGINLPFDPFKLFYMGLTVLTIILSLFTIVRPQLFAMEEDIIKHIHPLKAENQVISPGEQKKLDHKQLLDYFSEEKPYLRNDLKMKDLVEETGLSNKRITDVLSTEFNKSFFDLVNEYRSEEAIRLIKGGFHKQHTLPHLGEEAGFNSKTTFNRIFKKHTGRTPSEFIQSNQL
ncbi:MAG: helix-turn-helix domain-containing protein [Bacteroidales bacterium]|nr:helix-turn-helix domain-containing protein [Bacteroidales bacterium]